MSRMIARPDRSIPAAEADRSVLTRRQALGRAAAFGLPLALTACGFLGGNESPPLPGTRINVLSSSAALVVDPTLTQAVTLPVPVAGLEWAQQGGNPAHDPGVSTIGANISQLWSADIGEGTAYRHRIPNPPVVANGMVFSMSADGQVSAFDLKTGDNIWRAYVRPKGSRSFDVGGGVSYDGGLVYAATGFGEVICFDAKNGNIRWRKPLGSPARTAPTVAGNHIYVSLIDASIVGLDIHDGSTLWSREARNVQTGVLGLPAPAVAGSVVVAGFSSGDLLTLNTESGEVLWSDNLGATGSGLSQLSAIVGMPVIDQSRVFAGSLGGIVVSIDLPTGRRLWERDFAMDQTPFLAGDWLFTLSTDQQLAALSATTGQVKWVHQMPPFKNMKKLRNPIYWWGPVVAGDSLFLASNDKRLAVVNAVTGDVTMMIDLPSPAAAAPIVADGRILVTLKSGDLIAFG
ncbi:PQQ-binding-like beta-propeller repeat protein [Acidisoma cellulosilytica]|uniref:PQQ-binding-like beta-propeller repeat protein n=1 Tax=Acidisoma cellulosilyticum TaxID=2802395 RepID=A0A963Z6S1_9PROT|nr:PQQ-binding-like beta-propeller repeat protein [Acidisoma cellulosilyticum]MCB8883852.1 PQQ-binding-like beta-propeller repeat protein [Acidisoma cellulosilyticum]